MTQALRAAAGALLTWAAVLVIAGALDPSGLAAPIAWTGASPSAESFALLQYVLYGPLMLGLIGLGTWLLLRAATPAAPRRWVWWRIWLLTVGAVMLAKLVYSAALLAPQLASGATAGLPAATSWPYLAWATGITGVKAVLLGWLPGGTAALMWRPQWGPPGVDPHSSAERWQAVWSAVLLLVVLAVGGAWLAGVWWGGSPVGYVHTTDWRLLAPTPAAGWVADLTALLLVGALFAHALLRILPQLPQPRPGSALVLAGALGSLAAGLGLAVVQTLVAVVFGTDLPGAGDLWIVPSTYLRLVEGLSFGLLLAPVAGLAAWAVPHLMGRLASRRAAPVAVAVVALAVGLGDASYTGIPPRAVSQQSAALAVSATPDEEPPTSLGAIPEPARLAVRRDLDGTAVLADERGAQVVLRGVNVNQLGDYYAADPEVDPVARLTERDFADIAALGFDAVRLVLSWSLVQPRPDTVDEDYLATVQEAVEWARQHGIHVVLDMHQDAWGKTVVGPEGTTCRPGTAPMTGWDGAPEWASYFDGAPACMFTGRDLAPNVLRAFSSFYADREDIQTRLVTAWGRIAETFGGDPTVAGYDLLNEPSFAEQAPLTSGMLLGSYHARAITAIRAGELRAADGYAHPVFLEPSIWWSGFGIDPLPPRGFTTDPQVVFAPHLYNESITMDQSLGVTLVGIQRGFALAERAASSWGAPLWIGEWGSFRDEQANRAYYERFMTQVDAARAGSAIWVWKQACGDPHVYPSGEAGNLRRVACPDGSALPTRASEIAPVTRAYPRAAPGRLLALETGAGSLRVVGSTHGSGPVPGAMASCTLDLWVPGAAEPRWDDVRGVRDLRALRVREGSAAQDPSGGWRVVGCASGDYELIVRLG